MITWVWLHKLAKHKYRSFKVQTAETSGWLCPSLCTVYVLAMIWVSCYETVLFFSSFWFELWKFSHHSLTYLNKLIWIWWICSQRGNTSVMRSFLVSLQSTNESCWIRLWLYASEHFVWRAKEELQLPNSIIKPSATNCSNYSLFLILICIFKETKSWPRLLINYSCCS